MKTSELTRHALNWAVAKAEGVALLDPHNNEWELCWTLLADNSGEYYSPSTDWAQGGPIIEREGITVVCWAMRPGPDWMARLWLELNGRDSVAFTGPTPLIAAMRCYVHLTLGDEVDVPKELL
jgi:hypothetical protein